MRTEYRSLDFAKWRSFPALLIVSANDGDESLLGVLSRKDRRARGEDEYR